VMVCLLMMRVTVCTVYMYFVAVKKVLSLCDGLSAIDDIRNGVLCSLLPDFTSMLGTVTGPFAQHEAMSHVTVCIEDSQLSVTAVCVSITAVCVCPLCLVLSLVK